MGLQMSQKVGFLVQQLGDVCRLTTVEKAVFYRKLVHLTGRFEGECVNVFPGDI